MQQLVFFENLTAIIFIKPSNNSKNCNKKIESLNSFKQIKIFSNKLKFFQTS